MSTRLPIFPLGTVLFPGLVLPLHIFEERYRALVRNLLALPDGATRQFGVVAIRSGWEFRPATGQPDHARLETGAVSLYEIGCVAEVRQVTELPDGRFDLVTVGRRRFRVVEVDDATTPYLTAEVEWVHEPAGQEEAADRLAPRVLAMFRQYLGLIHQDPEEITEQLPDDPTVLSHMVAATAALTLADRQRLLAATDTVSRLRTELRLLNREAALLRQVRAVPVPLTELSVPSSPN